MKISIVTPVFNSRKTVGATVASVIGQSYDNFEHIIVDNLSSDGTLELIRAAYETAGRSAKLRILSEKDAGISDAFNKGIRAASGEIVAILNSDDCYVSNEVLGRVVRAFADPAVQLVHGNLMFEDSIHGTNLRRPLLCPVSEAMPINHPTMFVRRFLYEQRGLYPLDYRYAMDFEWICRLYREPAVMDVKSVYLTGEALTKMAAGGASGQQELKSIDEVERSMRAHGFWNVRAEYSLRARRRRIIWKGILTKLGFGFTVRVWRNLKWANTK